MDFSPAAVRPILPDGAGGEGMHRVRLVEDPVEVLAVTDVVRGSWGVSFACHAGDDKVGSGRRQDFPTIFLLRGVPVGLKLPDMAPRLKETLSKKHKEGIRQAALARHAARKLAGLPAPTGLPYITPPEPPSSEPVQAPAPVAVPAPVAAAVAAAPPAPRVVLRDDGTPSPPKPRVVVIVPEPPRPPVDPAPREAFTAWLRSRDGLNASDPRMSRDPVRQGAELEDRLRLAFLAGYAEGRVA